MLRKFNKELDLAYQILEDMLWGLLKENLFAKKDGVGNP